MEHVQRMPSNSLGIDSILIRHGFQKNLSLDISTMTNTSVMPYRIKPVNQSSFIPSSLHLLPKLHCIK